MLGWWSAMLMGVALLPVVSVRAQTSPPKRVLPLTRLDDGEPIQFHIRRKAGLSPETAIGDIEFLDIGRMPPATARSERMLSIVAHRTAHGWRISYACADSLACTADQKIDHVALDYMLPSGAGAPLDTALAELGKMSDPGPVPDGNVLCREILVHVSLPTLQHDYARACSWEPQLSALEAVLGPSSSK